MYKKATSTVHNSGPREMAKGGYIQEIENRVSYEEGVKSIVVCILSPLSSRRVAQASLVAVAG